MIAADILLTLAIDEDQRLQPVDIRVFILAAKSLDVMEFRPLPIDAIVDLAPTLTRPTVSRSLRRLVEAGYLMRGTQTAFGINTYRVPLSRRVLADAIST